MQSIIDEITAKKKDLFSGMIASRVKWRSVSVALSISRNDPTEELTTGLSVFVVSDAIFNFRII